MAFINILDHSTIDQIAAGEVVERPASIVKELVENALDAGSSAVTVEIRDGGISFIRVTDNGSGIEKSEIRKAFLRHATSKISNAADLSHLVSLGFRGEALSSIAAVSQVELITKTKEDLTGIRVTMEGAMETAFEEIGAPDGTTIMVRNVFFNVPARKKFLKTPQTEGSYIADLMEHLALSHPKVSFKFMLNGQTRFTTAGNDNLREVIYRIYGREVTQAMVELSQESQGMKLCGYLGKPSNNRSTRSFELYFINGRFIRSKLIASAIEDGYHNYLMQHKYPFCVLMMEIPPEQVDVNVHPSKMDVRFANQTHVYDFIASSVKACLKVQEMIPPVLLEEARKAVPEPGKKPSPEPFQVKARALFEKREQESYQALLHTQPAEHAPAEKQPEEPVIPAAKVQENTSYEVPLQAAVRITGTEKKPASIIHPVQMELYEPKILTPENRKQFQIMGQIFDTYWLVVYEDKLLMVDQHAAHEKVKYENLMKQYRSHEVLTQNLYPPVVITLTLREQEILEQYHDIFQQLGFQAESFGGQEISVRTAPVELYGASIRDLFLDTLDALEDTGLEKFPSIEAKIASMACKSAVKGNQKLSQAELSSLLDQLLTLENPYFCPHGRPTMISFSEYEIEKKFKRIV